MNEKSDDSWRGEITLKNFKMWSYEALKNFLSLRKKYIDGDYETLVYTAMSAYEENIQVDVEVENR